MKLTINLRKTLTITLIAISTLSFGQSPKKIATHKDLIQNKYLNDYVRAEFITAQILEYYNVLNSKDIIRREKFKLTYFTEAGTKLWETDLKLSYMQRDKCKDVVIKCDNKYVYCIVLTNYNEVSDQIIIYDKKGALIESYNLRKKLSVKYGKCLGSFSNKNGIHLWHTDKKDGAILITLKGTKISYKKADTPEHFANLVSKKLRSMLDENNIEEIANIPYDSKRTFDINKSDRITKHFLIPVVSEGSKPVETYFLELSLNEQGKLFKEKEFQLKNIAGKYQYLGYNALKKEYLFVNEHVRSAKKILQIDIKTYDTLGHLKTQNSIEPEKNITDLKLKRNLYGYSRLSTGQGEETASGKYGAKLDQTRIKYDPISDNYICWSFSSARCFITIFNSSGKLQEFSQMGYGTKPYTRGNLYSWFTNCYYKDRKVINGTKSSGIYDLVEKEIPLKESGFSRITLIPYSDGSSIMAIDMPKSNEIKFFKIKAN